MAQPNVYYHYTTKDGADKIRSKGKILRSGLGNITKDAAYGVGVYLTSLGPSNSKETIARNNWDGGWKIAIADGKVDYVIQLIFPKGGQPKKPNDAGRRDIYLINGDVILNNCTFDVINVDDFQARTAGGYATGSVTEATVAAIVGAVVSEIRI